MYFELLKKVYTKGSTIVHLHKEGNKINIKRGVRHGNTISPKLITAALELLFRRLTWETRGLKRDGEYLSHIRFADDILICATKPHELQQMLLELADENQSKWKSKSKTKVMMENDTLINICQQHPDRERRKLHLPGTEI